MIGVKIFHGHVKSILFKILKPQGEGLGHDFSHCSVHSLLHYKSTPEVFMGKVCYRFCKQQRPEKEDEKIGVVCLACFQ